MKHNRWKLITNLYLFKVLGTIHVYLPYYSNVDGIRMLAENERSFSKPKEDEEKNDGLVNTPQKGSMWNGLEKKR